MIWIGLILIGVLLICAVGTVISRRVWPRTICLLLTGIIFFFVLQVVMIEYRKGIEFGFLLDTLKPTGKLWTLVQSNLVAGRVAQAVDDLNVITQKWQYISPMNKTETVSALVEEIEKRQKANQASEATSLRSEPQR